MRNTRLFFCKTVAFALFSVFSCTFIHAQNIGIIPTPKQIEMQNGEYILSNPNIYKVDKQLVPAFVDTNPDQAYILTVTPTGFRIKANSETGLFYGEQSLKQLLNHYQTLSKTDEVHIPCMRITDYPLMKYRGWMDDISRGPIPSMDFLKREIATLASYKLNFFNLYTEHVFKLNEYPDIAPTDGLTAQEIKELEEYAAQYHVELFGNQQCFAHAEEILRIPFYQDMADTKANWNPGTEKTYDFLKYQLETVAKAYSSPFFNIDCDETEALGNGKAKHYVDSVNNPSQIYADHIKRVYNILKPLGKRVMMWGDIAAKDPVITAQLPKDMLMIVWSYVAADSYRNMMEPFVKQELEFMVAPGMSMWSTVYPCADTYTKNIANLVRDGYNMGALGMMNTAWDDSGESLFNSTWHGMAWAAEMAWEPLKNTEIKAADAEREQRLELFNSNFSEQYATPSDDYMLIHQLERSDIQNFYNSSCLFEQFWNFYPSNTSKEFYNKNKAMFELIEAYKSQYLVTSSYDLPQQTANVRFAYYTCLHQQAVALRNMLRHEVYSYLHNESYFSSSQIKKDIELEIRLLHKVKNMYMDLWNEECRPYSRNVVEQRYDNMAQELMNIPYHILIESTVNAKGETEVNLHTLFNDQPINYTTDGRTPQIGDKIFTGPFILNQSSTVKAATRNSLSENVVSEQYILIHKGLNKISKLNSEYATYNPQYAAAGKMALADGKVGGTLYGDGNWQGFWGNDIDVEFDFGKTTSINSIRVRFFQDILDWIMSPNTVEIYTSKNGKDYSLNTILKVKDVNYNSTTPSIYIIENEELSIKSRYVKVVVRNAGPLPAWHGSKGQPSYIFCDEIILN